MDEGESERPEGGGLRGGEWRGSRVEFARMSMNPRPRSDGRVESSCPSSQGALRVPSFRFPLSSHSLPPFTRICLTLVDSTFALQHGQTEDRHTTNHGPSLIPFTLPRPLFPCALPSSPDLNLSPSILLPRTTERGLSPF